MSIWFKEISIKDLECSSINMDKHLEIEFYDIEQTTFVQKCPLMRKQNNLLACYWSILRVSRE